jgi:proline iminopeptidase
MFDQRGCGKSTPTFCLEENDTWSLVEDMEKLRKHLKIDRWMLFGGSWGCTLSLVYAETHIDRVLALVLSGIFTLRPEELHWFYQEGTSLLFPDEFEKYIEPIPIEERGDLVKAYYKRLVTSTDEEERIKYAKAWTTWEMSTAQLQANPENIQKALDDTWSLAFARIECHYFVNKGFLKPNQVLDNAEIIEKSRVPVTIVQGRYDVICPVTNAWQLKKRIPSAEFQVVPDAGHSSKELGMTAMLVAACDKYKTILKK